jgi:hypothetical protein
MGWADMGRGMRGSTCLKGQRGERDGNTRRSDLQPGRLGPFLLWATGESPCPGARRHPQRCATIWSEYSAVLKPPIIKSHALRWSMIHDMLTLHSLRDAAILGADSPQNNSTAVNCVRWQPSYSFIRRSLHKTCHHRLVLRSCQHLKHCPRDSAIISFNFHEFSPLNILPNAWHHSLLKQVSMWRRVVCQSRRRQVPQGSNGIIFLAGIT